MKSFICTALPLKQVWEKQLTSESAHPLEEDEDYFYFLLYCFDAGSEGKWEGGKRGNGRETAIKIKIKTKHT